MLYRQGWILVLILFLREDLTSGEIYFNKEAPYVKLSNNALLSGKVDYSREGRPFSSFTGIPFGKIPERFKESQPVPAWDGIFDATQPGNVCIETILRGADIGGGEEDCLNLHVYVPMNNTQRKEVLPVMVWIHGGSFSMGNGYIYGPKFFMDEDVILVNINYRLGVFGFLSTGDSVVPGNNGLKDQVLALKWVQTNIRNFGGDPSKVTVFGESAGAALVHYLLLSPSTVELFQQAISQSGTALGPWAWKPNPRETAVKLATHLKCPTVANYPSDILSKEILTCLRGLSAQKLVEAVKQFNPESWPPGGLESSLEFTPVQESKDSSASPFLTESPWKLVLEDSIPHKNIPWMVGATEDEGVYFAEGLNDPSLLTELDRNWNDIILKFLQLDWATRPDEVETVAGKIRKFYFGDQAVSKETLLNLLEVLSDAWFIYGTRRGAIETGLNGGPVYLYRYTHPGPVSMLKLFGESEYSEELLSKVAHFADSVNQFNLDDMMPDAADPIKFDEEQEKFSKDFVKLWASFAKYGKPNYTWGTASKKEWKPIPKTELDGTKPLRWYRIASNPGYMDEGRWAERTTFWDQLYKDHFLSNMIHQSPTFSRSSVKTKSEL